jgi:hypothetical protein
MQHKLYLLNNWVPQKSSSETVIQLVEKFPVFYGTKIFITVFDTHTLVPVPSHTVRSTQSHLSSLWFVLIMSSHLRLYLSILLASGFLTEVIYVFSSLPYVLQTPPISSSLQL